MPRSASFTKPGKRSRGQAAQRAGTWVSQGLGANKYLAFVPKPLPPDPPIELDADLQRKLELAGLAIGRLDGIGRVLPGPQTLLYSYIRKEAVLSSQIEGTQSSLADLLLHENSAAPGVPEDDVLEVSNYIAALDRGMNLLTKLPLSLRLIREVHKVLVAGVRGDKKTPGEFRRSQNWIGGSMPSNAVFVPPPPHELPSALDALEKFIHVDGVPTLLKAGLVHAQFETIHPFLDGNGRVGRMLIPLMFSAQGVLEKPWLYVSLHFKRHRSAYYDLLQRVRTEGAWEEWIGFYLDGIASVADEAVAKIRELLALFERDREKVDGSRAGSIYQRVALHTNVSVYEFLLEKLAVRVPETAAALNSSKPTVARALGELVELGIAHEVTGRPRNRVYMYKEYVDILNRD
jgi:Fic family protein